MPSDNRRAAIDGQYLPRDVPARLGREQSDGALEILVTAQPACRSALAHHKAPTMWFECTEFPLTAPGKVQKFRSREALATGSLSAGLGSSVQWKRHAQ